MAMLSEEKRGKEKEVKESGAERRERAGKGDRYEREKETG